MTWRDRAACHDQPLVRFFEDPLPDEGGVDDQALAYARSFCLACPVRDACLDGAMADEGRAIEARRFGVRGAMTPAQRASLYRRGTRACGRCGERYDPVGLIDGHLVCDCGERTAAPIPDEGDLWLDRHTALSKQIVAWVLSNSEPGDAIPSPTALARQMAARKDDVVRVYRAMVEDGLVVRGERLGHYYRNGGKAAWKRWTPNVLRPPA